jgi:hypothetical protein
MMGSYNVDPKSDITVGPHVFHSIWLYPTVFNQIVSLMGEVFCFQLVD